MEHEVKKDLVPPNVKDIIEGYSVTLRPISCLEINARYVSWLNNPHTNAFLEVRHREQSEASIIDYVNHLRSIRGGELFAIFSRRGDVHIGNIAVKKYNPNGLASYGLMIGSEEARRFGAGGEVTILILEYLFRHPEIRKVHGGAIAANERACRNLESVGFRREGTLREHALLSSGMVSDVYVYGMLRREWETHRIRVSRLLRDMRVIEMGVDCRVS